MERLDIKQSVFKQIEEHRTPGTLITSNTSGIPIAMMNKGRSDDFQKHFAVTHFFNPPRYLKLFEVIPGPNCLPEVSSFLMDYGSTFLGKAFGSCQRHASIYWKSNWNFLYPKPFPSSEGYGANRRGNRQAYGASNWKTKISYFSNG